MEEKTNTSTKDERNPEISIVIPVKDEEESLPILYEKIIQALCPITEHFEIIVTNDGSVDGTQKVLEELHTKDARLKIIELQKNFGQTSALAAGIDKAKGSIVITMDADLQNDPADIPKLLEKIEKGYDIVSGWRKNRKDKWLTRRVPSMIANKLIAKITNVPIHDLGCALKAYRHEVLENVRLYGDMHRYLPIYSSMNGAKVAEIVVRHHFRQFGKAHYGLSRTFKVILDLITIQFFQRFLTKPMRAFGLVGALLCITGVIVGIYLTYVKIIQGLNIGDRPLLLLAVMLVMVGIQLIGLGILGEMMTRVYFESKNKSTYTVKKVIE